MISWAIDAASSPIVVSRATRVRSACAPRNASSLRLRSVRSSTKATPRSLRSSNAAAPISTGTRVPSARTHSLSYGCDLPVSLIAQEAGLSNLANFNRQFRRLRAMTPKQYRESFRKHGALPDVSAGDNLSQRPPSLERDRRQRAGLQKDRRPASLHRELSRSTPAMR